MYITPPQYALTFLEIRRNSLSHSTCKLIIFVSCLNVDAICSAKILSLILRKELIQYQLIPVVGYSDLKANYLKIDYDVTNVILIGCGALLDIENFLEINPEEYLLENNGIDLNNHLLDNNNLINFRRKIYIIDGRRPWNLENIFGSQMIVCFDDGYIDANLQKEKSAYQNLVEKYNEDDESDGYSTEDDEEILDQEHGDDVDEEEEEKEDYTINEFDDEETINRKMEIQESNRKRQRKESKRERNQLQDTIHDYYNQGTTIITSTTATVYALLSTIGETTLDNIWLTIIGTSSLDSQYPEIYDKLQPLLKEEVLRLKPSNQRIGEDPNKRTADTTTLNIERDYHLFLLRHWNLYDSFFYSSHVNSKLNLWTEDGKKKLHKMFAKMGVSLAVAQQKWLYMDMRVKKQLPFIFSKYLPMYGLEGIVRDGFIRTFGFTAQLSAMECVESLTALLELDKRFLGTKQSEDDTIDYDQLGSEERIQQNIDRKEKIWINNFWASWDALNMNTTISASNSYTKNSNLKKTRGFELLMEGLEHAKLIQQIIFKTGMSILERKLIKNLRLYRLCVLNDGAIPDLVIFNNPLMLAKLGSWIMENLTELDFLNNKTSLKPFVLASFDANSDTYLVIGLAPRYPRDMDNSARAKLAQKSQSGKGVQETVTTRLNTFSVAFKRLSDDSGAKVRIDSFESSIIEIRKEDLPPFLEKLTLSGLI